MDVKIKVTSEHIARGITRSNVECPVALAIKDQNIFSVVSVGSSSVCCDTRYTRLPIQVCTFIFDFDNGYPVEPLEFTLCLPEPLKTR